MTQLTVLPVAFTAVPANTEMVENTLAANPRRGMSGSAARLGIHLTGGLGAKRTRGHFADRRPAVEAGTDGGGGRGTVTAAGVAASGRVRAASRTAGARSGRGLASPTVAISAVDMRGVGRTSAGCCRGFSRRSLSIWRVSPRRSSALSSVALRRHLRQLLQRLRRPRNMNGIDYKSRNRARRHSGGSPAAATWIRIVRPKLQPVPSQSPLDYSFIQQTVFGNLVSLS